jgi:alkanesulfonate monooxygenase SsuD/methylene tetrahydromethanopterin reductase-like flavin-dependent oxidoreductase (luciferase family)
MQTRIGFRGNPDTVTRSARARGTPEQRASYDWWIDNGLALVGSPETVRKKLEEHQKLIGYDVFCANHCIGTMPSEHGCEVPETLWRRGDPRLCVSGTPVVSMASV